MSLFTPADGLLRTHVQWEDLQESVFEAFGADAIFGPNREVKDVGCGNGFMSRICLVSPDWKTEMKGVPKQFIVKISSQLPMLECHGLDETGHFNSEGFAKKFEEDVKMRSVWQLRKADSNSALQDAYSNIHLMLIGRVEEMSFPCKIFATAPVNCAFLSSLRLPKLHNHEAHLYELLKKYDRKDIPTPKVYFTRHYTDESPLKGYIIMEYIADGVPYHIFDNLKPESMLQPLKAIAKLQATAMRFSAEEKAPFQFNFLGLFSKFYSKEAIDSLFIMMRSLGDGKLTDKVDKLEGILEKILDLDRMTKLSASLGMEEVLCHGDLWSTNMIWRKGEQDVELAAVIDFQAVHYGCAIADIVRVMCACMSGKDRRENWEWLLEMFHSYVEEELQTRNMPYTLNMLKESFRQCFPFGAFMIVPMIGPLFQVANKSEDVEYKTKVQEVIFEKVECLLDDIYEFHRENEQRKSA